MAKHWTKLRAIHGFDRVPDDTGGRRMLRCQACGRVITALGVGYHRGGGQHHARCWDRKGCDCYRVIRRQDVTALVWDGACRSHLAVCELVAGPGERDGRGFAIRRMYGPPVPSEVIMDEARRVREYEAHRLLSVEECDSATTAAGCIWHPAPVVPRVHHWARGALT